MRRALGFAAALGGGWLWMNREVVAAAPKPVDPSHKRKIVILGSGWGAISLLLHLPTNVADVTIVSPRNFFLFTPLLPGITTGTIEPRSIIEPVRKIFERAGLKAKFIQAECTGVDPVAQTISLAPAIPSFSTAAGTAAQATPVSLAYDYLVVAVGAVPNTFGTPGVTENTYFLKELDDGNNIRRKIIDCYEQASLPGVSVEEKKRLLNFVVVGGGPTGIEFAGELDSLRDNELAQFYPDLVPFSSVTVIQSGCHVLNTFDQALSIACENYFAKENINVLTHSRVREVNAGGIVVTHHLTNETKTIPFGVCVWSTGVAPNPLVVKLQTMLLPPGGRPHKTGLPVDSHLRVRGAENVFALGDCAAVQVDKVEAVLNSLFDEADQNHDGVISKGEFYSFLATLKSKYPQFAEFANSARQSFEQADLDHDGVLSRAEFSDILVAVQAKGSALPATAQVAHQQGKYLAAVLNELVAGRPCPAEPFAYHHRGSFVKMGDHAGLAGPGGFNYSGYFALWLYRAAYVNMSLSARNRFLVCVDWVKARLFGRDISRS